MCHKKKQGRYPSFGANTFMTKRQESTIHTDQTLQTKTAENCCNPYNVLLLNILIPHLLAAFLLFHVTLSHALIYPISIQTSLIDPNQFILSFSATLPLKLNNLFCSFSFSLSSFTYTQHPHLLIIPYQLTSPRLKKTVLLLIRESRAVLTSCPITETPRPDQLWGNSYGREQLVTG